jgi:HD-GYP domain-containing protein (c-di-GMP phosphodiesterase class II)
MPQNSIIQTVADESSGKVNAHYLDKVMDLAKDRNVEAIEDIFDSRGNKLIAKGARISSSMQEKLILHRLHKPLEMSISVEGGIDIHAVFNEAKQLADTVEPIRCMLKAVQGLGASPLHILTNLKFGNAMSMMLTITERGGPTALKHSVMVSLIAICLAKKMGLSDDDQASVALAGLLHDIGELYIEPEYLTKRKTRLLPHEWRHVVVHPRIGQMLILEMEKCAPLVARAVSEHHERFDGSGYPRRLSGKAISTAGQILSVAEMMAGVFMRPDQQMRRAELAMKIIPGEHEYELVSAALSMLRVAPNELASMVQTAACTETHENVLSLFENIDSALTMGRELLDAPAVDSRQGKDLLLHVLQQTNVVKRAFSSTGLDICLGEDVASFGSIEKEILFEIEVASREIQWRLRDVARNLALQSVTFSVDENTAFQPLIAILDAGR